MKNPKTILATAYAVNPYKGSEDGMGWNFINQIARFNKVIAITRKNNREHIEKFMLENPSQGYQNIEFYYFDLPYWMRFWKRGSKGAMLYFLLWQRSVVRFIKQNRIDFDIAHNLNFHNDWTPSYLWKLKKPFVWGPIGHHPQIPAEFLKPYRKKYLLKDRLTWMIKKYYWKVSKDFRVAAQKADFLTCMNSSVKDVVSLKPKQSRIIPSVATEDFGWEPRRVSDQFKVISAGRLVPLKGFDLTILSFSKFLKTRMPNARKNCELIIVGSGPEQGFLENLVRKEGIENNVQFINWIERSELMNLFKSADAFLFPSHEGAGMVVAEALSFGLPVLCLDNSGPGEFINEKCGFAVPYDSYEKSITELGKALCILKENTQLRNMMRHNARKHFENNFHWNVRGVQLNEIYQSVA